MSDEDQRLVQRAQEGDLDAFEELVRSHRGVVYRVTARVVGDQEADDVTQDALLRAFHGLRGFRGEAPFRAWLLRVAHHTALNALEKSGHRPVAGFDEDQVAQALDARVEERSGDSPAPAAALESHERQQRLVGKLRGLSPEHRAVLVLRDVEGLSYEEIVTITEAPLGTVKGRLHRARRVLADVLRANTYDWDLPR